MKHLLQGEERGFWGKEKNKFFKMVLLFSVHSPDPFFFLPISQILICLTPFLCFCPQFFSMSCVFSLSVSSSKLSEVLSVVSHIFSTFFFVTSLKHLYEYCFRETMIPIIVAEAVTVKVDVFEMRAMEKQYDGYDG